MSRMTPQGLPGVPALRSTLSPEAQAVLNQAWRAAAQRGQGVTTGHVLFSLLNMPNVAQHYLAEHRVDRAQVLPRLDLDAPEPPDVLPGMWQAADGLAVGEDGLLRPMHVLAGLLRFHAHSTAVRTLRALGHDTNRLRNLVISGLMQHRMRSSGSYQALQRPVAGTALNSGQMNAPQPATVVREVSSAGWEVAPEGGPWEARSGEMPALTRDGRPWNELDPSHPLNAPNPYLAALAPPPPSVPAPLPQAPPPAPPLPATPSSSSTSLPILPRPRRRAALPTRQVTPKEEAPGKRSLAQKLKGRFGSRKPTRRKQDLTQPSLNALAAALFVSDDKLLSVDDVITARDKKGQEVEPEVPETKAEQPVVEHAVVTEPPVKPARVSKKSKADTTAAEQGIDKEDDEGPAVEPQAAQPSDAKALLKPSLERSRAGRRSAPNLRSKAERQRLEMRFSLSRKEYPNLSKLGRNLTLEAVQGKLDNVIGRDREIAQISDVLNKRRNNNPILVGSAGVGKTAVVEGLALELVADSKSKEDDRLLIELEMGKLLAGTHLRGAFAERLTGIKEEVARAEGKIIVFLDEIHHWMGAGSSGDGGADAAGELKASLARGQFPCVGATTEDEYRKFIEADPAFKRRFQRVDVGEPSKEDSVEILRGVVPAYSEHHSVTYSAEALELAVHLSDRYLPEDRLPDKAIGLLDMAGSRARRKGKARVDKLVLAEVLSSRTGVPVDKLLMKDRDRFLRMEEVVSASLIGHKHVVARLSQTIRRNYAGFHSGRPIGSFLFLGPTGVGKTELVRVLADFLFRDRNAIVRLDMSEYMESHAVSRMVGAPPGYVGYEQGGQLTEAVRRKPYQVVLFDEIEKAHPEVLNVLLQLLDDGRLTDGHGRTVDFSNCVVIMTSNLGAEVFSTSLDEQSRQRIGFGSSAGLATAGEFSKHTQRLVSDQAKQALRPELWNRIEERLVFGPLSRPEVAQIARLQFRDSARRLSAERNVYLEADDALYTWLIDRGGYDPKLGARPMRQTIQRLVENPVAELVLRGIAQEGDTVSVRIVEGQLDLQILDE